MKHILLSLILLCSATVLIAQTKQVYDEDFVFTDGLYLNKEQMQQNRPVDKARIKSQIDPEDLAFFDYLTQQSTVTIYNEVGAEVTVKTSSLWGYCSGGIIYINYNGYFNRVGIVGSICHFLGTKTYLNSRDPFYGGMYGRYGLYGPGYTMSTEAQQYLLNFETGEIFEYNTNNLDHMLMKDPELHDEFADLKRKKRNAKLFYYMRRFNEKHPLYVPVYE
ncbi:MAG: hypothetical protein J6V76_06395 [Bacteroidales bacterium]|nr:hypothetical protein [Bacteroidales bacterium]